MKADIIKESASQLQSEPSVDFEDRTNRSIDLRYSTKVKDNSELNIYVTLI
jgi:hypothetical protein